MLCHLLVVVGAGAFFTKVGVLKGVLEGNMDGVLQRSWLPGSWYEFCEAVWVGEDSWVSEERAEKVEGLFGGMGVVWLVGHDEYSSSVVSMAFMQERMAVG